MCLLGLDICFFLQIMEVFSYYVFKYIFCPFFSLFSFWDFYNTNAIMLLGVTEFSKSILICSISLTSVRFDCFPLIYTANYWYVPLLPVAYDLFYFLNFISWVFTIWYVIFYLYVQCLTDVLHPFLKLRVYLCDHYFEFSIRHTTYFCFA